MVAAVDQLTRGFSISLSKIEPRRDSGFECRPIITAVAFGGDVEHLDGRQRIRHIRFSNEILTAEFNAIYT